MEIFPIKPEAFGLEISDSFIKIAKLKKSGRSFKIVSFNELKISPGVVENGEIKDRKQAGKALKEGLEKIKGKKIRSFYVATCLPEEKAFLRVIEMPKMNEKELQKAVFYEAENYIPFPKDEVYLDFQKISAPDGKKESGLLQEILIAAFPKKTADSYFSLLKEAGLWPLIFETESMAVCRALIDNKEKGPVFLADLDELKANFTIFSGGSIRFSSFVSLKDKELSGLAEEIKKYIEYYHSHYLEEKKIQKIIVCGPELISEKDLPAFSRKIGLPAERGNPWKNILFPGKKLPFPEKDSAKYAKVLGLAMRAARIEKYD
jgi:Tfp pilus assembly PilM family ATPase